MGGRYLISGVQIGMLIGMVEKGDLKTSLELLDEIEKDQFIGTSKETLSKDVESLQKLVRLAERENKQRKEIRYAGKK